MSKQKGQGGIDWRRKVEALIEKSVHKGDYGGYAQRPRPTRAEREPDHHAKMVMKGYRRGS